MRVVSRIRGFDMEPITCTAPNAEKVFVEKLQEVAKFIHKKFPKPVPILWTKEGEVRHNT